MDLQSLMIFRLVAQKGSVSQAARELNYVQSNISTKIRQLEDYLQTPLFFRHNRGVTLTTKGQLLLKYTDKIFQLIEETTNVIRDNDIPRGPLSIGSMETTAAVHMPQLLSKYHNDYPNVNLALKTGTTEKNIQEVLQYHLDGAFVAGPVNHSEIIQKKFTEEELVLVTDTTHPDMSSFQDIRNRTLLVFPTGCSYRRILEQWLHNKGLVPDRIMEFDTLEAIIGCVCAGLGISLLPNSVAKKYVQAGILRSHAIESSYAKIPVVFIYRKERFMPISLQKFINIF